MAYREKNAWLVLACMLVAYGIYFPLIASRPPGPMLEIVKLFGAVAATQAVVVIAGTAILALRAGREGRATDERDRAIARRGTTAAYYVLLTAMIVVGVVMPFTDTPWKIVNTALFGIVISEIVRHAVVLSSYRRGWHG